MVVTPSRCCSVRRVLDRLLSFRIFFCAQYDPLQEEDHKWTHGVVMSQAVMDRHLGAVKDKLPTVIKGLDAFNGFFDGSEEFLRKISGTSLFWLE